VQFVTKVSLYFWNLRKILHLILYTWSPYCEKIFLDPYTVPDQWWSGHWAKKNFCCYFWYFWKVSNKSQGYFCCKCKKVKNQPTLIHNQFESVWISLNQFESDWIRLSQVGSVRVRLSQLGSVCLSLGQFRLVWVSSGQLAWVWVWVSLFEST
jgi:hypothetical protein